MQREMQQLWETEQEILDVIHRVCVENELQYSLAYGTLLGAIRHEGFIPWDDDIDLMMPRADYERLLAIWKDAAPKEYILQNIQTDSDFTQSFTKIRKEHTTFLQDDAEREKKHHKGIFVDIFPCDRIPDGKALGKIYYFACAVNLLYCRGYTSGKGGFVGVAERALLWAPKSIRGVIRKGAEGFIKKWSSQKGYRYILPVTIQDCRRYYTPTLFDKMRETRFQGKKYYIIDRPEDFLSVRYGDYMQLPPPEERVWKHRPILIDFHRNYEEIPIEERNICEKGVL